MREILFRAKCVERVRNGEWYYGHYVHQYGAHMIYLPDGADGEYGFDCYHIDTKTLGQYTGLTDKNGKKIFEGDIIKRMWNGSLSIYQVVFDKYLAAFIGEEEPYGRFTTFVDDGEYFEVIGNIHDNPELLNN